MADTLYENLSAIRLLEKIGFQKVLYNGTECFVFGRRASGSFDIRKLSGERVNAGVSYKKLTPVEKRKTILTERRTALPPHA